MPKPNAGPSIAVLMRAMFVIAAVAAAMLIDLRASDAYYGNGPWCAVESVGFGTVTVRSFEQCRMQTVAGNRGFCKAGGGGTIIPARAI
jgi:hypothetical protein